MNINRQAPVRTRQGFSSVLLLIIIGLITAWSVYHFFFSNSNPTGNSLYAASKGTVTDLGTGWKQYKSAAYNFSVDFPNSLLVGVQVSRRNSSGGTSVPGFTEVNPINNGTGLPETGYPLHIAVSDETGFSAEEISSLRAGLVGNGESNATVSTSIAGMDDVKITLWPTNSTYNLLLWFRVNPKDVTYYQDLLKQIAATVKIN